MKIQELVAKLASDDSFAADVKRQAQVAVAHGHDSAEWSAFVASLDVEGVSSNAVEPMGHWTTVTTLTSPECLTTTTTTGH